MTQQDPRHGPVLDDVDFDAFYRGEPPISGMDFGFDVAPWDIGEPQPVLVEVESEGLIASEVLDVGCGLGENALFLAERGYHVTGVDSSSVAVEQARERAAARGVHVDFHVADAARLEGLDGRFTTVVDSALFHCLPPDQRPAYAAALRRVTVPGARLHLFCFPDVASVPFPVPVRISEDDLRSTVGREWTITELRLAAYTGSLTREQLQRMLRHIPMETGTGTPPAGLDQVETDERGRLRMPVWQLTAERR